MTSKSTSASEPATKGRILPLPDYKAEKKAATAVHIEFPMFGKKMLCGQLLRDFVNGEQYVWTKKDDVRCSACRKEARRIKLYD